MPYDNFAARGWDVFTKADVADLKRFDTNVPTRAENHRRSGRYDLRGWRSTHLLERHSAFVGWKQQQMNWPAVELFRITCRVPADGLPTWSRWRALHRRI